MKAIILSIFLLSLAGCKNSNSKPEVQTNLKEISDTVKTTKEDGVDVQKPALTETETKALPPQ